MIEGEELTDEEQVLAMCQILGVDEATARFIIAIERGEIQGDVVEVDATTGQPTGRNVNDGPATTGRVTDGLKQGP